MLQTYYDLLHFYSIMRRFLCQIFNICLFLLNICLSDKFLLCAGRKKRGGIRYPLQDTVYPRGHCRLSVLHSQKVVLRSCHGIRPVSSRRNNLPQHLRSDIPCREDTVHTSFAVFARNDISLFICIHYPLEQF